MTRPLAEIPLGDPNFFAGDPDDELAALRRRAPVSWHDAGNFWVVTGHDAIQAVSRDTANFCSGRGVLPSDHGRQIAAEDSILYLDPPRHQQYRKLVSRAFTPGRVASLEPRIRQLTRDLLGQIDPDRSVDLVDAVCAPLPLLVIAELLGLPADDHGHFRVWSDAVMDAATALNAENAQLAMELVDYLDRQLDERQSTRTDDLLGALVAAEVDGAHLSRAELRGFCLTLLVAGNETTRSLLAGGVLALAQHPEQRERVLVDRTNLAPAIEEMLRWVTPIMAMARTTTSPVRLEPTDIDADSFVLMVYGAANRDDRTFGTTAGRFDVGRSPNNHLAFGFGEHYCIGAGLARLEASVFFDEFLNRWPAYVIHGDVEPVPSTLLRQIDRLPVRCRP